jgi:predicted AAA+ superfamily ATPase
MLNATEHKMAATILVKNGVYRNTEIVNQVFPLVKQYQDGAHGGFVTVDGTTMFGKDRVRIRVSGTDAYEFVSGAPTPAEPAKPVVVETDEEIMARIRERFEILDEMASAVTNGDIRAMIVTGPPGVGKSFGIERVIENACLFDKIAGKKLRAEVVKGNVTPIALYATLYKYSDPNCVLVFDDADSVFFDDVALNLLKGALDTGKKRKISWLADSATLRREGIPDSFNFKGSVIFITNLSFSNVKSAKLRDHLTALESRCHFVDLKIDTTRDKILRIKQIMQDGMLDEYDFDEPAVARDEIVEFINKNAARLREISLRTAIKVAQLRKAFPSKWVSYAETSLLKSA